MLTKPGWRIKLIKERNTIDLSYRAKTDTSADREFEQARKRVAFWKDSSQSNPVLIAGFLASPFP